MIEARHIEKTFHTGGSSLTVLKDISFVINDGEFVGIMGPSGAGKSTLLYQLGLLDHPTKGQILIDNIQTEKLSQIERAQFRLMRLGFVFQDYALLPELTALENVSLTLRMQGFSRTDAEKKALQALEKVGLANRTGNLPSQLSGGEQQRVSIARAIAHDPQIVFADEPTANLDSERSYEIMEIFKKLNQEGQTIVMVTHEPEFALYTKRILQVKDGTIVSDTPPAR